MDPDDGVYEVCEYCEGDPAWADGCGYCFGLGLVPHECMVDDDE